MTPEELEKFVNALEKLTPEALEKLLQEMQDMAGLEMLQQMLAEAQKGVAGSEAGSASSAAEIEKMLARMGKTGEWSEGEPKAQGSGMGNAGQANGGQAKKGPDDGSPMKEEHVRGQLDSTGRLSKPQRFEGIPKPATSERGFNEALQRAADAAEESLGRDDLPPGARPFVRRYFESKAPEKK